MLTPTQETFKYKAHFNLITITIYWIFYNNFWFNLQSIECLILFASHDNAKISTNDNLLNIVCTLPYYLAKISDFWSQKNQTTKKKKTVPFPRVIKDGLF